MAKKSRSAGNSLISGAYHGRVLELIQNDKNFEKTSSKKVLNILVLVEDQVYSLKIRKNFEIFEGAFISFNVNANCLVENIKIEQIPLKFKANGDVLRWRNPSHSPSRMRILRMRHKLMSGVREWFDKNKFIETETPSIVNAPSPESQIFPVKTDSGFLITSPEFQMKRLLVGGFERIYQLARCYRRDEIGAHHNPEFTLLEWYRSWEPLEVLIDDVEQLVMHLTKKVDGKNFCKHIPSPPWPRVKVRDLFKKHLDIELEGSETAELLMDKAKKSGFGKLLQNFQKTSILTNSLAYEQIFYQLWIKIENEISSSTPLFVYEWPLMLPSLARKSCDDPRFVDRVELYVKGMELANGFEELTDLVEQRLRFEKDLKNRKAADLVPIPLDEKFLSSLEHGLPRSSGMALGIDRLIMWLCSLDHIREVMCFSNDEV